MGTSTSVLEAISLRPLSPRVKSRIGIFLRYKTYGDARKNNRNKMIFVCVIKPPSAGDSPTLF